MGLSFEVIYCIIRRLIFIDLKLNILPVTPDEWRSDCWRVCLRLGEKDVLQSEKSFFGTHFPPLGFHWTKFVPVGTARHAHERETQAIFNLI